MRMRNNNVAKMDGLKRRVRVEELMRSGWRPNEIAVSLGVTEACVGRHAKLITEAWLEHGAKEIAEHVAHRLAELDLLHRCYMTAFERSKQNGERVQITYDPGPCPDCRENPGMRNGDDDAEEWCKNCDGKGEVLAETVVRTSIGQEAGDPAFYRGALDCVKEKMRLQGLRPKTPGPNMVNVQQVINRVEGGGVDILNAPRETILRALEAIRQCEIEAVGCGTMGVVDVKVIETEPKEDER